MPALVDPLVGLICAVLFWGSYVVPMKMSRAVREAKLDTLYFQGYVGIGVMLSSVFYLSIDGCMEHFTPYGILSGMMWVPCNFLAMTAVNYLGLAKAQASWAAAITVVSFLWGFLEGVKPNLALIALGLVVMLIGVFVIASTSTDADASADAKAHRSARGENNIPGDDDGNTTAAQHLLNDETRHLLQSEEEKLAELEANTVRNATGRPQLRGYLCIAGVGALAGSIFVPLHYAPSLYHPGADASDIAKLEGSLYFAFSQGVGTGIATFFWVPLLALARKVVSGRPLPPSHIRSCALPGMLSGAIWNAGNGGATLATLPPLGQGVGYPLSQAALLVSAAWGVFYFHEITGAERVRRFWIGAIVTFLGMVMAGYFSVA